MTAPSAIGPVAEALLGEPNRSLSNGKELRYGAHGSLSVNLAENIWYSHEDAEGGGVLDLVARETGGDKAAAADWLREHGFAEAPDLPMRPSTKSRPALGPVVEVYDYRDETGTLLFQVTRHTPKTFRQGRPDGRGGWVWNRKGVRNVPYRLPDLAKLSEGDTVFLAEGEKDVDLLWSLEIPATTNAEGAGKWHDDLCSALRGLQAVVIADNDQAGLKHAGEVMASLRRCDVKAVQLDLDELPSKGDVADWLDAGGTKTRLYELAETALRAPPDPPKASLFTAASALAGRPVPPRQWLVHGLIPDKTVTMLSGDGGTGKSLLALQLAVAAATGRHWIGREPASGTALFLSAEDDEEELHRRLDDIVTAEDLSFEQLDRLQLQSLAGEDALLAGLDNKSKALCTTPLFDTLEERMADLKPRLLVLDTPADLHSGDENVRSQARQFVGFLRGLAIRHSCAVILLAHPSLTGISSGTGASGSTAWNGSVRSRLYLERVLQDGYEPDADARVLRTMKANYGRTGGEIGLTWQHGVFVADRAEGMLDQLAGGARAERVFLKLLRLFTEQGRDVYPSTGSGYAPKIFSEHPESEGCTKRALATAMETLLGRGDIATETVGPDSKRRTRLVEGGKT
ncbi:MAG: AAA family ATPase [Pseudomonadota bacterium]